MTKTFKEKIFGKRLTPARVAILGMLLALLITFKYVFGFIPGVEIVSFLIIFFALFLPLLDLVILVAAFNLLILVLYGFGNWWFAYWPIFMLDALVSFSLKRFSKHRFFFAFLCFLGGASVGVWYFFSDMIFFDTNYAMLNIVTAVPINLIEGFTSMFMALVFGPSLVKVFNQYSPKFWTDQKAFEFHKVKSKRLTIFLSLFLSLGALAGIVTLFLKNDFFVNLRNGQQDAGSPLPPNTKRGPHLLKTQDYNDIYSNLQQGDAAIVLISDHKHWTYYARNAESHKAVEYISNDKFYISYWKTAIGAFLRQSFDSKTDKQISPDDGTATSPDSSPFVFRNGITSLKGVSSLELRSKEIIEITYDEMNMRGGASVAKYLITPDYILNRPGDKIGKTYREIWVPIVSTISGISILLIIIWTPNLIRRIKKRKEDTTEN